MTVSPEAEERKICPQNSHREGSSDQSRNFRSHTNPEHPLKVAEELLLCVTNPIREKAPLQLPGLQRETPAGCTLQEPSSVPCPSQHSWGFHRHPARCLHPSLLTHPDLYSLEHYLLPLCVTRHVGCPHAQQTRTQTPG